MFGLNEISWTAFLKFLSLSLISWYCLLTIYAWAKSKKDSGERNFEDLTSEIEGSGHFQPMTVSAGDYPSEILPVNPVENISLPASLYEETGCDDGLMIELFTEKNSPVLATILPEIHFQQ